jgi:hypothetical protein
MKPTPPPKARPAAPAEAEPQHEPPRASRSQSVSSAAERLGADDGEGTQPSSDWMAERRVAPAAEGQPEGTPVNSPRRDSARRGRARESRRGSY